jgi:hypothetical protein
MAEGGQVTWVKRDPVNQCMGKEPHDQSGATRAARMLRRHGRKGGNPVPYHCPHCGHWHIGNKPHTRGGFGR